MPDALPIKSFCVEGIWDVAEPWNPYTHLATVAMLPAETWGENRFMLTMPGQNPIPAKCWRDIRWLIRHGLPFPDWYTKPHIDPVATTVLSARWEQITTAPPPRRLGWISQVQSPPDPAKPYKATKVDQSYSWCQTFALAQKWLSGL